MDSTSFHERAATREEESPLSEIKLYYTHPLRALWPHQLAVEWLERYPDLFDDRDVTNARSQPAHHFCEWFTAIQFYHGTGMRSLVEKAEFGATYTRKQSVLDRILSADQVDALRDIGAAYHVQWPDLFVYERDGSRFHVAEAKGPQDSISPEQAASHRAITRALGCRVDIYLLKPGSVLGS